MNVLITGGVGFIGFHLAKRHLERGDRVILLDNLFKAGGTVDGDLKALQANPRARFLAMDMTTPLQNIPGEGSSWDVVYHLAAINGTNLFYEMPYQLARTNLLLTLHLLDWLEDKTVGKLVYTSSSEVYSGADQLGALKVPTDESAPVVFPQPTNVRYSYGTSKFMGEFLCFHFGNLHKVPVSVVRYHNIYGPRMGTRHVIPEFIARLKRRENPFKVYGGMETRAFCYVRDAVEATMRVAETPACSGEIIHIGNSLEEITIRDLAERMMRQMGAGCDIQEGGRRSGSVLRRCPDVSKLERLTGYRAATTLEEGLKATIAWYGKA